MSIADKLKIVAQKMEDVYRTGLFKYAQKSTASGEMVILENSAPEPFVDMIAYGHSWQNGTPSPTNPIPIESATEVKVIGKNWYSGDDVTTTRYVEVSTNPIPIGTYTISAKVETNYPNAEYYGVSILNKNDSAFYTAILNAEKDGRYYWTMELTEECYELGFYVAETDSSSTNYTTIFSDIQIELGNDATEYEPYTEQTLILPTLREGDYISYADKKLTRCSAEYVFTGEEDFDDLIESYDAITTRFPHKSSSPFLCTHAITDDTSGSYWTNDNNLAFCASAFGVSSVEEFKNVLREKYNSDTPCKIVYQLAEPIETDLTDEQIYAFKRLRANGPTTTIIGQGQVDVTYIVDNRQ